MTWFFTCNLEWITTNCTRSTGSYNFVSLRKILLALIYSKLHSKSCDYLNKVHVLKIIKKFMSYYKCIQTCDPRAQSMEHSIALLNKRTASRFPLRSINGYWITVWTFYGMLGGLIKHCLRSLVFPSGGWKSLQFTSTPNTLTSVCILSILFLYISWDADKENLFNNQELLYMVIISFILKTLVFALGVTL